MQTYLIHYEDRHAHAQHLLWYTDEDLTHNIRVKLCGGGPGLCRVMVDREIAGHVVRLWPGGAETRRQLRKQHNNRRLCPLCNHNRLKQRRLPL